jgi:hypothetical protein
LAAFGREPGRIAVFVRSLQCDARNALERLRNAAIRQRADILRGDRVDHLLGVLLDGLRAFQALANSGDDDLADRVVAGRGFLRLDVGRVQENEYAETECR